MSHTATDIKKHVKVDVTVLALFAILTLIHVAVTRADFAASGLIVTGLYIARFGLVAYYFYYLTKGKSIITITLLLTAFFLAVLLIIPMFR